MPDLPPSPPLAGAPPAAPPPSSSPTYGTCRYCGDAVPPNAATCPICGSADPIRAGQESHLNPKDRRRFQLLRIGRVGVVLAVVGLLAVLMVQAVLTPAPVAANPLTETQTLKVAPGRFVLVQGWITGADYIEGNFTVLNPPGANLTFSIYNSTEFPLYDQGLPSQAMQPPETGSNIRIVYAALYSDTYSFVFANEYPASSNLTLTFYLTTTYETNVVVG